MNQIYIMSAALVHNSLFVSRISLVLSSGVWTELKVHQNFTGISKPSDTKQDIKQVMRKLKESATVLICLQTFGKVLILVQRLVGFLLHSSHCLALCYREACEVSAL